MSTNQLVVAAIIVDNLEHPSLVLAARRSRPPHLAGQWEFPGGKVEKGESPLDALTRELTEELQIAISVGAELPGPIAGTWPIATDLVMQVWWATILSGHPTPTDAHDAVRWVPFGELRALPWLPADVAIVDQVQFG